MRDARRYTTLLLVFSAVAAAVFAPATLINSGADAATRQQNSNRPPIRIGGKPAPTPTPTPRPAVVIGRRPGQTSAPPPAPTPAQAARPAGQVQGQPGPARQGTGGAVVVRPGGAGGGVLKSPGGAPPSRVIDTKAQPVLLGLDKFDAPRADKPVPHQPFTAEELMAVAPPDRITKRPDGKVWVKYWKKNPQTGRKEKWDYVPIETYVAQLNQYELLVNKAGCTLRKGPLAPGASAGGTPSGGVGVKPGQIGPAGPGIRRRSISDAVSRCGVLFRIKSRRPPPGLTDLIVYHDPNLLRRKGSLIDKPEIIRGPVTNPVAGPARLNPLFGVKTRRVPLAPGLPGQARAMDASASDCEGTPGGGGVALNPVCPDPTGKNCPDAAPGGGIVDNSKKPCGTPPDKTLKCLYGGKFAAEWASAVDNCARVSSGGNGWFDAALCANANFAGQGQALPSPSLRLDNDASAFLDVGLFGQSIQLLRVSAEAHYDRAADGAQSGPPAVSLFGGEPLLAADYGKTIRFLGPQALITIGPVPVTLRSGLDARFGLKGTAEPPTNAPNDKDCKEPGQGKFGVGFEVTAGASVWAEAALDAFVASAGVRAELILTDDSLALVMNTTVTPSANEIKVGAGYKFHGVHLKGVVSAFVEVDLLVYEERFDVELFSFGGIETRFPEDGGPMPIREYTFGATGKAPVGL